MSVQSPQVEYSTTPRTVHHHECTCDSPTYEPRSTVTLALPDQQNDQDLNVSLRSLPSVDSILAAPDLVALAEDYPRQYIVEETRNAVADVRSALLGGNDHPVSTERLVSDVAEKVKARSAALPTRVINATGVIIHTNLGRAPLSEDAARAAQLAALGYSDLEYDLDTGGRGSRHDHVSSLLKTVTGAEAGIAVNNNAAAALLVLSTLAGHGGEVIVSRSEAVEIGGGFRVPDVMAQSGAKLVDVGTTNRTYAHDYEAVISPNTSAILKVHRSNFAISGFVHEDQLDEITKIANAHNIPLVHDLGSGSLIDTSQFGIEHEPTVQESVQAGAHLTLFSGDKLFGGPQAGMIVGKAELVARVAKHPLARAVRIDKMTLAALNSTLRSYIRGSASEELPVWQMISASVDELNDVASEWSTQIESEVVDGVTAIGGGSAPGQTLPTKRLIVTADVEARKISQLLRRNSPPIIGRIENDSFFLDPRTVLPNDRTTIAKALNSIAG